MPGAPTVLVMDREVDDDVAGARTDGDPGGPRSGVERSDGEACLREVLEGGLGELRLPLNAIIGWLGVLRNRQLDAAAVDRALATLERHAQAQAQLLDDMAAMVGTLTGETPLASRVVDLAEVAAGAIADVQRAADARSVTLRQVVDPGRVVVRVDPERLRQVLAHLVARVAIATRRGGLVRVAIRHGASRAEVAIRDITPGAAPPSSHPSDPLLDLGAVRTHGYLGLGAVRHVLALHGGDLETEQVDGERPGYVVILPPAASSCAGG